MMERKECQSCQEIKDVSEFPVRNDRSGRLRPYCRNCANSVERSRYDYHKRSNPFRHKATRAKSRAASLGVPFDLTPEHLEEIWTGFCPVFGVKLEWDTSRKDENAAELDRLVPSRGYVIENVSFISRRANRLKNNVTSVELRRLLEWMEKLE